MEFMAQPHLAMGLFFLYKRGKIKSLFQFDIESRMTHISDQKKNQKFMTIKCQRQKFVWYFIKAIMPWYGNSNERIENKTILSITNSWCIVIPMRYRKLILNSRPSLRLFPFFDYFFFFIFFLRFVFCSGTRRENILIRNWKQLQNIFITWQVNQRTIRIKHTKHMVSLRYVVYNVQCTVQGISVAFYALCF